MVEPEMQKFTEALERELTAEDIDTHLEGCIGCGNCGHACAWYLATGDPKYHPKTKSDLVRRVYKAYIDPVGRILAGLGMIKKPTVKDLEEMRDSFWSCTMCGRCSLACMQGVSNRRLTKIARTSYNAANILPEVVHTIRTNSRKYRHSFGLTPEKVLGGITAILKDKGLQVPIDAEGADYLWLCSAIGNTNIPHKAPGMVSILNASGLSYTISSRIIDTGTEIEAVVVDPEISKQYLERIEEEAERLRVRAILVPECACDIRTFIVDSSDILERQMKYPVDYVDHLLIEMIKGGKIPVEKVDMKATYHDPCWTTRQTGYIEEPRELLGMVVKDFVEMTPNREYNYCCNAGAGPMRMYPAKDSGTNLRRQVSVLKAKQIEKTGADCVLTPCATCYLSLTDTAKFYNLPVKVDMLIDVVYEAMMKALKKEGREDIVKFPANYESIPEKFRYAKR